MRNILIILAATAAVLIVGVGLYQWLGKPQAPMPAPQAPSAAPAPSAPQAPNDATAIRPTDHVLGSKDAPVVMIEYASLTCPHCANFHATVLPSLKTAYIDAGKVALVFRDFPLDGAALRAAMMAECAGPGRYFGFIDILFDRQRVWAADQDVISALKRIAALGGMSGTDFDACLANKDIETAILQERLEAEQVFKVNSTPSFVVDGRTLSGGKSFEELKAVLDPLIAKAGR